MLSVHVRLCPNTAEVAAKIMDGEAIIINLSDGMYYSLDCAGARVWEHIQQTLTLGEIAAAVGNSYEVGDAQAEADVLNLARDLLARGLVRECTDAPPVASQMPERPVARLAYETPRLNAYHDMAELLALDPPHPGLSDTLSKFPPPSSSV